jgi:cold shock CspA family protein
VATRDQRSNQEVPMIGTLRLSASHGRLGFIVPRGGGVSSFVHVGQLTRSGIMIPSNGLKLSYDPTTLPDGRRGVTNVKVAK